MKKRLLSILLVVTLVFQPISVEATQEESIEVISETETEAEDTEATEMVAEETEAESASQEVIDLENEMVTFNTGEEIELQEVFVEDAEGVYQEGSFKVPMSEADSELALLSATEEETWENWETYIKGKLEARSGEITVSSYNIATSDISTWYWGVINENPDLYYVSGAFSYSNNNGIVYSIYPTYIDGYDDAAFQNATAEAMAILTDDMTDLEKAIALHDYIVLNCEYDYDNFLAGTIPDESYSAYGVLVDRIAVCQGYALAYKYLLQEAGITCYMVSSATMNHAWNMIQLNGKYYQVDATWDDPVWDLIGRVDHTYMFVSDTKFQNELKHENWQVTYRNKVLSVEATDTSYDNSFWVGVSSPLVLYGDRFYYIDSSSKSICSIPSTGGTVQKLFENIGTWYVWGNTNSYWTEAYSGLFLIGDRLYFNTPNNICSIKMDGTDKKTEFTADTTNGYIYGSAYCQRKVLYSIHQNPNLSEREDVLTATLDGVKEVSQVYLDQTTLELKVGETKTLTATILPSDATEHTVTWSSNKEEIASVSKEGVVSAKKAGECVITAAAGGKSATCTVKVTEVEKPVVYKVTFIGANGKEIKVEEVTQGQDATLPDQELSVPEGYIFSGWEGNYKNVQKNEIVTAKFTPITYTIAYELNGGSNGANNPTSYTIETSRILLEDAYGKEGYQFVGWYNNADFSGNPVKEILSGRTGNMTLYAKWKDQRGLWMEDIAPLTYTGKAVKPENIAVYYGDKLLRTGIDYVVKYKNNTNANTLSTEKEKEKAPTVIITGKGNYTGSIMKTFMILPKSLEDEDVQVDNLAAPYKKNKVNQLVPTVKWNTKKLANKKDYQVRYPDDSEGAYEMPGDYEVVIEGTGNYTGTRTITLSVASEQERLISKAKFSAIPTQKYSGNEVVLTEDMLKITYNKEPLVLDQDYTLEYGSCVMPGTYQVLVKGKGIYKGVKRVSFKIQGIPVSTMKVGTFENPVYSGEPCTISPDIYDKEGNLLREGEHYELTFTNHTQAGTATMTITGLNQYSGTLKKKFKVLPYSMEAGNGTTIKAEFVNGTKEQIYEKGGAKPEVKVTFKGSLLTEGVDYTVTYRKNTKVNLLSTTAEQKEAPAVIIKGKNNFTKTISLEFAIQKKDIADVFIVAPDVIESTKAGKYKSSPILIDENGKKLSAGTDYVKTYQYYDENGNELGAKAFPKKGDRVKIVVTGKGNYSGETSAFYEIIGKGTSITSAKVKIKNPVYYTGERITFSNSDLEIKLGSKVLGTDDFEIVGYYNNVNKGTAQMMIKGKGEYGGVKQVNFTIKAQPMKWWVKE